MSVSNAIQRGNFDLNNITLRKPLEFPDGSIQKNAYTGGGGVPTLEEVLIAGDDAQGESIAGLDTIETENLNLIAPAGDTVNFTGKINQVTAGLVYNGNQLKPTIISSGVAGASTTPALTIADTTANEGIRFNPRATNDLYNPIVAANDMVIACNATAQSFTLCCDSATTNGVVITDSSVILGAGGAGANPANRIEFNTPAGVTTEYGAIHHFNGGVARYSTDARAIIPSSSSTSATVIPSFEMLTFHLTGDAATVTQVMTLGYNLTGTTNYAVFPSIYYGFTGAGTYNAVTSSSAINSIIISNITATEFTFNLEKAVASPVNVYLTFLIVYQTDNSDYPKTNA